MTIMGIEDKNTKNSIKSKNYHKSKHRGSSKNYTLIDWCIVTKSSVPCSGRKRISDPAMSVDSIKIDLHNKHSSLVRLKALSTGQKQNLFRSF